MNWKFWEKESEDKIEKDLDFTDNISAILEEQDNIIKTFDGQKLPHIEKNFYKFLEAQKPETMQYCRKIIDEFIEIEGEKLNGEVDIARHINLLVRRLTNLVWHDFRNVRENYLADEVYNKLAEPYRLLRETVVVESSELRDDLDEYQRDFVYFNNLCKHIVDGYDEKLTNDRKDFFEHAIGKVKTVTKMPKILNERPYLGGASNEIQN